LIISLRDQNDPGSPLVGYGWAQTSEAVPAMEHIDPTVINAGQICFERTMPEINWNASAFSGNLFFFINSTANGGIDSPASLSIANVGVWNLTALGVS
jgi:hypothetical protein